MRRNKGMIRYVWKQVYMTVQVVLHLFCLLAELASWNSEPWTTLSLCPSIHPPILPQVPSGPRRVRGSSSFKPLSALLVEWSFELMWISWPRGSQTMKTFWVSQWSIQSRKMIGRFGIVNMYRGMEAVAGLLKVWNHHGLKEPVPSLSKLAVQV